MKVDGKVLSVDQIGRSDIDRVIEEVVKPGSYKPQGVGVRSTVLDQQKDPDASNPMEPASDDLQANEIGVQAWYIAEDWANNKPLHLTQSELCHGVANSILQMLDKGHGRVPAMVLIPQYDPQKNDDRYVTDYKSNEYDKYNWNFDHPIVTTENNGFAAAHAQAYDDYRERPSISAEELFD